MLNSNSFYADRTSIKSVGEEIFEQYCQEKSYKYYRLGFDEKNDPIANFSHINAMLRNLPDYVVETPNGLLVVQVKGTGNFKKKEYDLIPLFMEWYSTSKAPLVYAFCFRGEKPRLIYPEKVIELYKASSDQRWSDGVIYRNLNI